MTQHIQLGQRQAGQVEAIKREQSEKKEKINRKRATQIYDCMKGDAAGAE